MQGKTQPFCAGAKQGFNTSEGKHVCMEYTESQLVYIRARARVRAQRMRCTSSDTAL